MVTQTSWVKVHHVGVQFSSSTPAQHGLAGRAQSSRSHHYLTIHDSCRRCAHLQYRWLGRYKGKSRCSELREATLPYCCMLLSYNVLQPSRALGLDRAAWHLTYWNSSILQNTLVFGQPLVDL